MQQSDLTNWLFGQLQQVLIDTPNTGINSESDLNGNVDIAEGDVDHPYPFIGIQTISNSPLTGGIGSGEIKVDDMTYSGGILQSITYRKDSRIRYDLIPVTDGRPKLRDDLSDAISDHFGVLTRTDGYPDDVTPRQIGENTPQDRPDEFIRASGTPLVLEYERTIVDNDPDVAQEVNVDVDVSGSNGGVIDESDSDKDAFDETFN